MTKFLSAVALVALFVFGINWWFGSQDSKSGGGFLSSLIAPEVSDLAKNLPNGLANIRDNFSNLVDGSLDETRENIASALDNARNKANETFSSGTGAVFDSVLGNLGIASHNLNKNILVSNDLQVTVNVKVLEETNFSIKNINKEDSAYKIDWGDSTQSNGVLRGFEELIVSHSFQWPGSYKVLMPGQDFLVKVTY